MVAAVFDFDEIGKRLQNRWIPVEGTVVPIVKQKCNHPYGTPPNTCPALCMRKLETSIVCENFGGKPYDSQSS